MTLAQEIKKEQLKNISGILKKLDKGWVKLLAAKMFPGEDEDTATDKVYNIIGGRQGRDQATRVSFVNHATTLKNELEEKQQKALEKLNNL